MSPHVARPLRRAESDSNRSPEWRKCPKNWIYKDYVRETKLQPEDKTNQTNQYSLSWYTAWLKYYRYSMPLCLFTRNKETKLYKVIFPYLKVRITNRATQKNILARVSRKRSRYYELYYLLITKKDLVITSYM